MVKWIVLAQLSQVAFSFTSFSIIIKVTGSKSGVVLWLKEILQATPKKITILEVWASVNGKKDPIIKIFEQKNHMNDLSILLYGGNSNKI